MSGEFLGRRVSKLLKTVISVISVRVRICTGMLFVFGLTAQQTNQLQGSVPGGPPTPGPLAIGIEYAIQHGLKFNLGLLESQTASQTASAERIRAQSALLPQVTGTLSETEEQLNLKTFGFNFAPNLYVNIPSIVGPFSISNVQVNVSQRVLDRHARRNLKSARASEEAAILSMQGARDLVVQAVANAYLLVIADASRVVAIRAQVDTDQALYQKTQDQPTAGLAAGIDVLRAQVQLKIDLQSAAEQVAVAGENLVLANQTLEQSRNRFTSGVMDNIEVVQAQGSVATAIDKLIAALDAHNIAKVELARALGLAGQGVRRFIEVR
jgi:outer membrane protein TolC